jgi:TRAP-type C4-dicarboxylate transport system permease small subunit
MGDQINTDTSVEKQGRSKQPFFDYVLDKIFYFFLTYVLLLLVFVVVWQVIARAFNFQNSWTEESSRWGLVWASYMGTAYFVLKDDHINVDLIKEIKVLERFAAYCEVPLKILSLCFYAVIAYGGILYVTKYGGERTSGFGLPNRVMFFSCPVSFSLMVLFEAINLARKFLLGKGRDREAAS